MNSISSYNNLKWLWWLRTMAMIGQTVAIVVVTQGLHIPLPIAPLWFIMAGLVALNLFTRWRINTAQRISDREFFIQLCGDMLALFGLLYFTGGASNPFASLFILQVVIAAITLPAVYTWCVAGIAVALYTVLMFWNVAVPYFMHHHRGDFFSLHVQGMWISFMLLAVTVAWFVVRMNDTIRRQETLLAEAEKMAALGTLATGAAHELGTPLATIAIMAEGCEPPLAQRFAEQIGRCKQMLSRITAAGGVIRAESGAPMPIDQFLQEIVAHWQQQHPAVALEYHLQGSGQPRILAEQGLRQALLNLLTNAADASPTWVRLDAHWTSTRLMIRIDDHGAGVPDSILAVLGTAGVSTKVDGLGLGFFLAKSVATRLEGTLQLRPRPERGTRVEMDVSLRRLVV